MAKEYLRNPTIHTTIGIYPNGFPKFNGVKAEHLEEHIQYNKDFRPGRALMVDGVIVYGGYESGKQVDEEYLKGLREKKIDKCTAPYQ